MYVCVCVCACVILGVKASVNGNSPFPSSPFPIKNPINKTAWKPYINNYSYLVSCSQLLDFHFVTVIKTNKGQMSL